MKININIDNRFTETEITINCGQMSEELEKVIATLRILDFKITGTKNNQVYILEASKILYIDTVDKRTFLYTKTDIYETNLKLYRLEELLSSSDFFRASKSCIINFNCIKSLRSDIAGRIIVTMENDEKLIVSRQYSSFIKKKLEVS